MYGQEKSRTVGRETRIFGAGKNRRLYCQADTCLSYSCLGLRLSLSA